MLPARIWFAPTPKPAAPICVAIPVSTSKLKALGSHQNIAPHSFQSDASPRGKRIKQSDQILLQLPMRMPVPVKPII